MCGICGWLRPRGAHAEPAAAARSGLADATRAMTRALAHRGPDGQGAYLDPQARLALGVARLAIVDVPGGAQPFQLPGAGAAVGAEAGSSNVVTAGLALVANGEIYNHRALRRRLESLGARFRSACDVEVILHGYRAWGDEVVERLRGAFAFALWDAARGRLLLARDALGIAPLVYAAAPAARGGGLAFASEVKALLAGGLGGGGGLDPWAVDDLLAHRYVREPRTMWRDVRHLPPGHRLVAQLPQGASRPGGDPGALTLDVSRWYRPPGSGLGLGPKLELAPGLGLAGGGLVLTPRALRRAADRLEAALDGAIARRRQADAGRAEVGMYLSGGLDSAVVAGLAARSGAPLPAWTHGFSPQGAGPAHRDETDAARRVARAAGAPLTRVALGPADLDALPAIVRAMEQPVANSDVVGLWALAREASQRVKAVLVGEGADELFGSYPHVQLLRRLGALDADRTGLTRLARGAAVRALDRAPAAALRGLARYPGLADDPAARARVVGLLRAPDLLARYEAATQLWPGSARADLYTTEFADQLAARGAGTAASGPTLAPGTSTLDALIDHELGGWLPGYHLGRDNRVAMAHGLEVRLPYLDREVVDAVVPLAAAFKVGGLPPRDKRLLRRVARRLAPRVPRNIARRPKGPVRVPLALFGDRFPALVATHLSPERVLARGLFRPAAVEALKARARAPHAFLAERQLFAVLLVELWHEVF